MFTEKQKAELKAKREKRLASIPFGFEGGQELQDILDKDSATPEEKEILRARKSYLTPEQIKHFGLDEEAAPKPKEPEAPEEEEAPEEPEKPKKKKGIFKKKSK